MDCRRADLRHLLCAHVNLCPSYRPHAVSTLCSRFLRNVHRWLSQCRTITLWVVSRPTFLALDVLGLRRHRAVDDDLSRFRRTVGSCWTEGSVSAYLCRAP